MSNNVVAWLAAGVAVAIAGAVAGAAAEALRPRRSWTPPAKVTAGTTRTPARKEQVLVS